MQHPNSKLPPASQRWGRSIEQSIADLERENAALRTTVGVLQQKVETVTTHASQLQNYVRAICSLAGYSYPPTASEEETPGAPPVIVPDTPDPVSKTITLKATWSCTWGSGGFKYPYPGNGDTDAQSLFQRGSGAKFGMWRFDLGPALGKKITNIEGFVSNISTYYNGAFTAVFGTHGNSSEPITRPAGRSNGFDVSWTARQAKWFGLDKNLYSGFSSGAIQGLTLGDNQGGTSNYARFAGVGRSGAPQLRVTYIV